MKLSRFAKFAWFVLIFNLGVVLWGAFVRATGAGAGCGSHWPLCNGVVIPRAPAAETIIEFIHRLTSGAALVLVVAQYVWARRAFPKQHRVRKGANLTLFFIITEALVGAGLVLFEWVAYNQSVERVISMSIHLVNTFLLLAALALTAWWASGGKPVRMRWGDPQAWAFGAGFLIILILGVSGAITALGDTLFPAGSLAEGIAEDFADTAHFLVRLRVWHPLVAIVCAAFITGLAAVTTRKRDEPRLKRFSGLLSGLFFVQLVAGAINLVLLAPVAMQIIHLLLADLVWILLVLFTAEAFAFESIMTAVETSPS